MEALPERAGGVLVSVPGNDWRPDECQAAAVRGDGVGAGCVQLSDLPVWGGGGRIYSLMWVI
jgi:hypothetical protein